MLTQFLIMPRRSYTHLHIACGVVSGFANVGAGLHHFVCPRKCVGRWSHG
jgi:hypothetical protein